ncbi:uncharacterized protein RCO7_03172 [Rhynchosporium graminicola]|uniref:Zn(2)-C6 fungal-type domain-containing protein n=1 Tax=Rhynchosporium graminicola TaxID=2792576 RepID=A0A1E1LHS2_9HELO|nr:uncharacterized protein RCO7_03172 [Rhynchosporium commune]
MPSKTSPAEFFISPSMVETSSSKAPHRTRKRASTPRSKTGCVTCKIRRLKCGEEKPSCHRCVKSGWHCDGYDHVVSLPTATPLALAPIRPRSISTSSSQSGSPTISLFAPSLSFDLYDEEQRYFQSFIDDVSTHLQGHDTFFWRGVALQESHTNFSVRHGLVAIGALARSTDKSLCGSYRMDTSHGTHREFALRQYEKAIQGLRQSMDISRHGKCVRATVISCLVLAFFDNFIGNDGFALQHIRHARDIMSTANIVVPAIITTNNREEDHITAMFLRLDVQALCVTGIEDNRTYIALEPCSPNFPLPTRFTSVEEARHTRDAVVEAGYNFFYHCTQYSSTSPSQIPPYILRTRDYLIQKIHHLHNLMDALMLEMEPDLICHPLSRPESLKLTSTILLIRLTTSLGSPETSCDELAPYFEFLFDVSKDMLEYEAAGNSCAFEAELFTPDSRTITPLFLIATKCRSSPSLRRQAISLLLSSHRREWMYDSLLAGRIGEWMLGIEEEGMDEFGRIPECARAWGETVTLDLQRRSARVRCRQHFLDREGEMAWRWRERDVCW